MNDITSTFIVDVNPAAPLDDGLVVTGLGIGGTFFAECWKADGTLRWRERAKNIIPNAVLNDILNVYFAGGSATTTFYMGIVDNAGFTTFAPGDTMASHSGWAENTNYTGGVRPTCSFGAASGQSIQNGTQVTFNMNPGSPVTIRGFFLSSSSTLGGTAGNLVATAAISTGPQSVSNGDTVKSTYQIPATTS
jgi:hypothetical protein